MKSTSFFLVLYLSLASSSSSQVLNNARVLGKGDASLGAFGVFAPSKDFDLIADVGYGIGAEYDLGFRIEHASGTMYLGVDVEWLLVSRTPLISISLGAHSANNVGLDGTLNLSVAITRTVGLYTGLDSNVEFDRGTLVNAWIFVGIDVDLSPTAELIFEVDPRITNSAADLFAGGVRFYL